MKRKLDWETMQDKFRLVTFSKHYDRMSPSMSANHKAMVWKPVWFYRSTDRNIYLKHSSEFLIELKNFVLQMRKPMRANHCFSCNACIAKQDHHSIWINGCIGNMHKLGCFIAQTSFSLILNHSC